MKSWQPTRGSLDNDEIRKKLEALNLNKAPVVRGLRAVFGAFHIRISDFFTLTLHKMEHVPSP